MKFTQNVFFCIWKIFRFFFGKWKKIHFFPKNWGFLSSKKVLWFCSKLAQMRFRQNNIFQIWNIPNSDFSNWKKIQFTLKNLHFFFKILTGIWHFFFKSKSLWASGTFFWGEGEKKSCSNLSENWLRWSSDKMTKSVFTHKRENFLMGLKMDFEFFEVWQIYKRFPV